MGGFWQRADIIYLKFSDCSGFVCKERNGEINEEAMAIVYMRFSNSLHQGEDGEKWSFLNVF